MKRLLRDALVAAAVALVTFTAGTPALAAAQRATILETANLRAAPRTSSAVLDKLAAGTTIDVRCWTTGEPTYGDDGYGSMWLYTSQGGWVHSRLATPVDVGACGGAAYYDNCDDAWAAGAGQVHAGEPGYGPHLDRDNDGIGCEWND